MDKSANEVIIESLWGAFRALEGMEEELEGEWDDLTPSIDTILENTDFDDLMEHGIATDLGMLTLVEISGGEGDGAPLHAVVQLGERYFQLDGTYSSWDSDWWEDDFYEVSPKEVTVVQFERKV